MPLQLARISDYNCLPRLAARGADLFNGFHHIHALNHGAKDNVLAVQPGCLNGGEKELGAVGARACVGHAEQSGSCVAQLEVLVGKGSTVDRLTPSAVACGKVATLTHEVRNHAVEAAALIVQGFTGCARAIFSGAEGAKIFSSFGHYICPQLHYNAPCGLAANCNVKKYFGVCLCHNQSNIKNVRHGGLVFHRQS